MGILGSDGLNVTNQGILTPLTITQQYWHVFWWKLFSCTFLNFKQNLVQFLEDDFFYLSYLTQSYLHLPVFLQLTNTDIITKS